MRAQLKGWAIPPYNFLIQKYAKRNRLKDWLLVKAIIRQESDFLPQAVSKTGARGLMQIMPKTWDEVVKVYLKKDYAFEEAFDPEKNIEVGCRYLQWIKSYLLRYLPPTQAGLVKCLLASYNAGIGRVQKAGWQVPEIKETQEYVRRVTEYWKEYRNSQRDDIKIPRKKAEVVRTLSGGATKEAKEWFKKEAK